MCKESIDIRTAIETLAEVKIALPTTRNTGNPAINTMLLSKDLDIYMKRESIYRQNKTQMFSVVIGQCSEAMTQSVQESSRIPAYLAQQAR